MKRFLHNQKGSVLIVVALAMVAFMGMAALSVDLGTAYVTKSNLQKAADAASLAGAEMLPDASSARTTAITYAGINGISTSGQTSITNGIQTAEATATTPYNGDSTKVKVVCTRTVNYIFAKVLGINSGTVTVSSVAQNTGSSIGGAFDYTLFSGSQTVPLSVSGCNLTVNGVSNTNGGSVHTNNAFSLSGSNLNISKALEATTSMTLSGCNANVGTGEANSYNISGSNATFGTKIISAAPSVAMPDLSATLMNEASAAGQSHSGDGNFTGNNFTISGPTYYSGKVAISGSNWSGTGCIIASGNITISGSNLSDSSSDAICVYSINGNVTFSGSNINLKNTIVYAPKGQIGFSGSNVTITGRVIGNTISLGGSNPSITGGTAEFNSLPSLGSSVKLTE